MRVLIVLEDWVGGVARTGTYFEEDCRGRRGCGDAGEDGEFLLEPLSILEEIGSVILVKVIPPLCRVRIESGYILSAAESQEMQRTSCESAIQIGAKDIADLFRSVASNLR